MQISATSDANADTAGRGDPVAVRIYQLTSRSAFEGAEFFALYHSDSATLGADLVKQDEFLLVPGTSRSLALMPDAAVRDIGVFAGHADFQHASWRATAEVPAHQTTTTTTVIAARGGLQLAAKSQTPPSVTPGRP